MNAIVFYTHVSADEISYEYNFYDNKFAPGNLVVRKIWMAMLNATKHRLTHLEVEYNDKMLADKMGAKRAGELLRFLGATRDNIRENRSGEVVVSRHFRSELTAERYEYFYHLLDVSELSHYRLLEQDAERIVFYFNQYLLLRCPEPEAQAFVQQLEAFQVPYKLVSLT
jgi:hypothetical protein